jgi:membrane protein implicated in regulation of membrane protease activity
MSEATVWWILAAGLVGVELMTSTFYLLMIAIGMSAAALGAHAQANMTTQLILAAMVGGGAVALWHWRRAQHPAAARASANKDVNMDIGETVQVKHWNSDHHTTVSYRGADWSGQLAPGAHAGPGPHRIVEVLGNRLILAPDQPFA